MKRSLVAVVAACAASVVFASISSAASTADLALRQKTTPQPGGVLRLPVSVYNKGPSSASRVTVTENISGKGIIRIGIGSNIAARCKAITPAAGYNLARRCTITSLGLRHLWKLVFTVRAPTGTAINSHAVAHSNTTDPVSSNNSSTQSSWTGPVANLSIAVGYSQIVGSNTGATFYAYSVSVKDSGPNAGVQVTATSATEIVDGSTARLPTCSAFTSQCVIGSLAVGATWDHGVILVPTQNHPTRPPVRACVNDPKSFDPNQSDNCSTALS